MILRKHIPTGSRGTALLASFEAPQRSYFSQVRWNVLDQARRGVENRLLDAAYVAGYASKTWAQWQPQLNGTARGLTALVTNRRINRWILIWTLATIWLCY